MFPQTETNINITNNNLDTYGKKSFVFDFVKGDFLLTDGRVTECEGIDALKVWIEKILHTKKARFEIYLETEYGCHIEDLIVGSNFPVSFIESELKREIEDALFTNSQITAVSGFELIRSASTLTIKLEVQTIDYGGDSISLTF